MTGIFLIIILAVVWYVAGIFHSFALMLYVVVNLLLIVSMYILTRIYKRNVTFDFDVNLAEGLKNSDCQLRINVGNKTGISVKKLSLAGSREENISVGTLEALENLIKFVKNQRGE